MRPVSTFAGHHEAQSWHWELLPLLDFGRHRHRPLASNQQRPLPHQLMTGKIR